ncbi:NACHT, LRR and PYD domains-containing protein 3-like [Limanda limanda]|uniref:NACHT, LRR and PYD domains-containing protein 3-like n=1 Tax=Limanda limanda TaxID=27771 RepID=UPI0029C7920C|nr:NACHT, LRR and PYD domains-containing protein 3-like [Limanda limanda]
MMTVEDLLLETLEMLGRDDFKAFRWHLQQEKPENYSGFGPIPRYKLEEADRLEAVTLMVQKYSHHAVELAKTVLGKMDMNDVVQYLSDRSSGAGVRSDVEMHMLQPLEKLIEHLQRTIQKNFQSRFMCVQEGLAEKTEEQCLKDIFIELKCYMYITDGGEMHINEQHEIRLIRNSRTAAVKPIDPSDIFKCPIGKPSRTVVTTGVAGIGKTFLGKKFVLDWAEGRKNQDVHLIFPFSFSKLNHLKGERFSLAELIHKSIWETRDITDKDLNHIFAKLKVSGNCDINNSQYKLLFVLDGLDESRLQMDLTRLDFDVTQSTSVEVLLTALISGNLLPSARVWITTRPAAVSQIHRDFIKRMTVVRGFTDPQKEEYFNKKFPEQGSRIIVHIKASLSLFIICHIPVFCWITSTVLQDVLKSQANIDLPTTLTEMYTEFLLYQIKLTEERCGSKKSIRYIKSLAKLAFDRLLLNTSEGFPQTNHQSTIQSIKKRIRDNTSPERSINLFHCLNELRDDSLVKVIQQNLSSGSLSARKLSPAHWLALVFILLSSEDTLEVFDLKKYCPSEEGLLRLIPVDKASKKSL